jgi:hypothetical protein
MPKAAYPSYWDADDKEFKYDSYDILGNPIADYYLIYNGKCRGCGGTWKYTANEREEHKNCREVKYEYDTIETQELKAEDTICKNATGHDVKVLPKGYVQLARTIEGTQWDNEPTYRGEPNTDEIIGKKYYEDYFIHYSTYIPTAVQGDFDFEEIMSQTGLGYDDLLKLLEREEVQTSIPTLSYEDYFVGGSSNVEVEENGAMYGYIGPGMAVVCFENGTIYLGSSDAQIQKAVEEGVKLNPSTYGNTDQPSYGCCQMIAGNVKGFYNWMMEDPDRTAMWDKIFGGISIDCGDNTEFTQAWKILKQS